MSKEYPVLYLDTNVLINYIYERDNASVNLLKRIRLEKWPCVTSSFTWLEIYDVERSEAWVQARRSDNWMYSQIIRKYSNRFSDEPGLTSEQLTSVHTTIRNWLISFEGYIKFQRINDDISIHAERLCATTNIESSDALHLATAVHTGCAILVTNDDKFFVMVKHLAKAEPNKYPIATRVKGFDNALIDYSKTK